MACQEPLQPSCIIVPIIIQVETIHIVWLLIQQMQVAFQNGSHLGPTYQSLRTPMIVRCPAVG
ncbi:hypothetical protein N7530_009318 [Penicillium desertorum]|uniref:Uncharacterized protein n=1 Tax=Penicillium desertorum TaxID=1303715 RepID=A0A9W9WIT1_9EURO|nr:hypothetical protein N7530_009318 [Penicillium desertorum]